MLNRVLPVPIDSLEKRVMHYRELTTKIFKYTTYISYDTKIAPFVM